jgi:hypothetical protein
MDLKKQLLEKSHAQDSIWNTSSGQNTNFQMHQNRHLIIYDLADQLADSAVESGNALCRRTEHER